jgi:hypothetical protein
MISGSYALLCGAGGPTLHYYFSLGIWNLESGSFSYLRNSVCKYIRNSAEYRKILLQKIPRKSVSFSKKSVFRRKTKTHFCGHPTPIPLSARLCCRGRKDSPGGEGDGGVNILEDERNRIALLQRSQLSAQWAEPPWGAEPRF